MAKPLSRGRPVRELTLHRGQMEVFSNPARFKVVVAGRRWGKTRLAGVSIVRKCRKPKQLIWYVAPTYRMARSIMWPELFELIPRRWIKRVNETLMLIQLVNGTRIELKGADNPDSLRGVGLHHLIIDEAQDIDEQTWTTVLRPTLASTAGDAMIIGTPKSYNFLYNLYMRGQKSRLQTAHQWHSWQFPTITSPFIPVSEIEAARSDMDEKTFRQEFEASFETMSGRVYHAFDRKLHLGDYAFNPKLPIWIGQDFNIDPMSGVIMQPQPNGEIWVVDEIVLYSSNTEEMSQEVEKRYWRQKQNIIFYPDPAGANRAHTRGESDLDIIRDAGFKRMKYRRKHPRVADRVNAVNRMLRDANGKVRLRIDRACKHTIDGFEQTIYKKGTRDVDKSKGMEHPIDALGYSMELEFPVRKFTAMGVSL